MEQRLVEFEFHGQSSSAHVTICGEVNKPQILCLHGIGSSGVESFGNLAPYLQQQYQLILLDWVGFGQSSRYLGPGDTYGAEYCAEWLQSFVDAACSTGVLTPPFHLLALSMSAIPVVLDYNLLKDRLGKLILVNPAGLDRYISRRFAFALTSGIIGSSAARLMAHELVWRRWLKWDEVKRQKLLSDLAHGAAELRVLIRYARAGILPYGRMKPTHYLPGSFVGIDIPVLLLCSRVDHVFYRREYLTFASSRLNWQVAINSHHDHNIVTQRPQDVAKAVEEFLSS